MCHPHRLLFGLLGLGLLVTAPAQPAEATGAPPPRHTFTISAQDFLLDGKPLQIRSGEIHFARVPREYWRHRLRMCRAMGLNAVCAYLFWNFHEGNPGTYDWTGQADARRRSSTFSSRRWVTSISARRCTTARA